MVRVALWLKKKERFVFICFGLWCIFSFISRIPSNLSIYNPILPNLRIYHEHLRKSGERCVKALQKVQVSSSSVGQFQSQPCLFLYQNFQNDAKRLLRGFSECSPKGFPFKPKRTRATFPAKVPQKMKMRGFVHERQNGGRESIVKRFAKEEMKYGHLVLSTAHLVACISSDGRYHSTQVKLEPGHGARLAMFSARFNEKTR